MRSLFDRDLVAQPSQLVAESLDFSNKVMVLLLEIIDHLFAFRVQHTQ